MINLGLRWEIIYYLWNMSNLLQWFMFQSFWCILIFVWHKLRLALSPFCWVESQSTSTIEFSEAGNPSFESYMLHTCISFPNVPCLCMSRLILQIVFYSTECSHSYYGCISSVCTLYCYRYTAKHPRWISTGSILSSGEHCIPHYTLAKCQAVDSILLCCMY